MNILPVFIKNITLLVFVFTFSMSLARANDFEYYLDKDYGFGPMFYPQIEPEESSTHDKDASVIYKSAKTIELEGYWLLEDLLYDHALRHVDQNTGLAFNLANDPLEWGNSCTSGEYVVKQPLMWVNVVTGKTESYVHIEENVEVGEYRMHWDWHKSKLLQVQAEKYFAVCVE